MSGELTLVQALRCPICCEGFVASASGYVCRQGHSFDRAKEGYFNLLPVQKKNSKEPGDSREQLRARQHFLEQGHYQVLVDALLRVLGDESRQVIDLGAGEGYFTRNIAQHLAQFSNGAAWVLGVDVAKEGVRLAAQASRRMSLAAQSANEQYVAVQYVVASNFDVPCVDASADCIVRIFAPSLDAELARLLKPAGRLIIVAPAPDHLKGLRQTIYREVLAHEPPPTPVGFKFVKQTSARGTIQLREASDILALLAMTPFSWRLREADKAALAAAPFSDEIAFDLFEFEKL